MVQTADGTNRICSCARLRVFDPCNPPPAEEAWNEFGSCGPECQGVGESRSILVLPVPPVDDDNNPAACSNGQCWDLKACWAPVTPAELGIEVPEAVRSASLFLPSVHLFCVDALDVRWRCCTVACGSDCVETYASTEQGRVSTADLSRGDPAATDAVPLPLSRLTQRRCTQEPVVDSTEDGGR